ncbi:MAG: amidohydrolase family protein [Mycobacterium sp.]
MSPEAEVAAVRGLLDGIGLEAIIDVHTHFMPKRVMDKVWAYFDGIGPLAGRQWPISYRLDEADRVERLRQFGVAAFTSLVYPHKPDMAEWLNWWATEFAATVPDCLHTATFYPEPSAPGYVRRVIDAGARVFKAHIQVGDYSPTDPLLAPVWALLEETQIPTVIHAGSGPQPGRHTGPAPVAEILRRHPRLRLIVAHMGLPEYRDFLDLARRYDGLYLDTTMVFTEFTERTDPFPPDAYPALTELADKIVFGSDFPNIPYPYRHALESITGLGLGEKWCREVLYSNGRSLFPPVGADSGD